MNLVCAQQWLMHISLSCTVHLMRTHQTDIKCGLKTNKITLSKTNHIKCVWNWNFYLFKANNVNKIGKKGFWTKHFSSLVLWSPFPLTTITRVKLWQQWVFIFWQGQVNDRLHLWWWPSLDELEFARRQNQALFSFMFVPMAVSAWFRNFGSPVVSTEKHLPRPLGRAIGQFSPFSYSSRGVCSPSCLFFYVLNAAAGVVSTSQTHEGA